MLMALAMAISFVACGNKNEDKKDENTPSTQNEQTNPQKPEQNGTPAQNAAQNGQSTAQGSNNAPRVTKYEDHGIRFDIPKEWQDNFKATYQEHGSGDTAYTMIEFTYHMGQNDVKVMTIASFGEKQWEAIKKSNADAEKMKIGTSKDGKTYYTLRIEEQKFENAEEQKMFDTMHDAAKKIQGNIKITK